MDSESQNFLDQNSGKKLLRMSAEEISSMHSEIASLVADIEALSDLEEQKNLLSFGFGSLQNSIIHLAAKFGDNASLVKILNLVGNDRAFVDIVNDDSFTPLHFAAIGGHIEVVRTLLDAGARQSPQDSVQNHQWAPIHYATREGHQQVVESLIASGVDKDIKTYFGLTPLVIAVEFGWTHLVKFLLSIGVAKNTQTADDNHRMTALHYAVIGGHSEIVSLLLNSGINREKETVFGLNVLEFAAKYNNVEIVSTLLGWGLSKWDSAFQIAQDKKNAGVAKRIEQYRQMKKNLFTATWLKFFATDLIAMIRKFNRDNRYEMKIILSPEVFFNAYGIVALQQDFGIFRKTQKSFPEFIADSKLVDLSVEVKALEAA